MGISFDDFLKLFDSAKFQIPLEQKDPKLLFPDFLKLKLSEYEIYISPIMKKYNLGNSERAFTKRVKNLVNAINKTISCYYQGNILEATNTFNLAMSEIVNFDTYKAIKKLNEGEFFYRSRLPKEGVQFSKEDLFHIKFEDRHLVSTNRYSVPGFPALYLGDSSYVCWEEFNRPKMHELWFSLFQSTRELNIIQLLRYEDIFKGHEKSSDDKKLLLLLSYLLLFPLVIACTVKVRHPKGNFKPEYIIPQLLLQYISKDPNIDGIKFPSTKVNYNNLVEVEAYNYVFPVKNIDKRGFCSRLVEDFHVSEPSSLEIEEILYNPQNSNNEHGGGNASNRSIELLNNVKCMYDWSSFGVIESKLLSRVEHIGKVI